MTAPMGASGGPGAGLRVVVLLVLLDVGMEVARLVTFALSRQSDAVLNQAFSAGITATLGAAVLLLRRNGGLT